MNTDADNNQKNDDKVITIVGIGASAGGLEALQLLLSNLPDKLTDTAIAIAQHLSPTYESKLVELLARQTHLPVEEISNGSEIQPGIIYITPPDREVSFRNNRFHLVKSTSAHGPRPSIDNFFSSIANDRGSDAVGIILSGTGSDGSDGIREIKKAGGLTVVQKPESAKYNGMPLAAIESGYVDIILEPGRIGSRILQLINEPLVYPKGDEFESPVFEDALHEIMELLSGKTGTDFSRYKPATISRRLQRRMNTLQIDNLNDYLKVLNERPGELEELFKTILIGVTQFFRDTEAFEAVRNILPNIFNKDDSDRKVRVWVAGCATGEEPYTLAIMLSEYLETLKDSFDVQIFATDIDENAISVARRGIYDSRSLENTEPELIDKYFEKKSGDQYQIDNRIRQMILFSKHDVTTNPPFLKLDLISCRNLLIYFGQDLQRQVLPVFHYALNPGGYLLLGKSETIGQFTDLFSAVDSKYKLYMRKRGHMVPTINLMNFRSGSTHRPQKARQVTAKDMSTADMVKETLFNTFEHPYTVVNDSMEVVEVTGDVRDYLRVSEGVMNLNIVNMIIDPLKIEIRSLLTKAMKENTTVRGNLHSLKDEADDIFTRLAIKPLIYSGSGRMGGNSLYAVIFEEYNFDHEKLKVNRDNAYPEADPRVDELENELASTKEHLQNYIEELETSTEELQSLNEELQSTNEELQSSNEELETSNEELQSTNEELQIAYSELRAASVEIENQADRVKQSENNLQALLNNTLQSFILLDRDYRIIAYNQKAAKQLKELSDKTIKEKESIINFLPENDLKEFRKSFEKAITKESVHREFSIQLSNTDTRWFISTLTPISDSEGRIRVISLSMLDITESEKTRHSLEEQNRLVSGVLETADIGIGVTDANGEFIRVNHAYNSIFGYNENELLGKPWTALVPPDLKAFAAKSHKRFIESGEKPATEWKGVRKDGSELIMACNFSRMNTVAENPLVITTVKDITDEKNAIEERRRLFDVSVDMMAVIGYDGYFKQINPAWEATLGFSTESFLAHPFLYYVHPDDKEISENWFQQIMQTGQKMIQFENRFRTVNGDYRWIAWSYVQLPEKRLIYAVARDITESRKDKDLLRDTQRAAHVGGWEYDVSSEKLTWTEEVYRIHELPLDYRPTLEDGINFYHPEFRPLIKDVFEKALNYGEYYDIEARLVTSRKRHIWVRATGRAMQNNGKTVRILGTFQDITARKQSEDELQKLSLVASNTTNAVVITDENGVIEWVNEGFVALSGYSSEEATGQMPEALGIGNLSEKEQIEEMRSILRAGRSFQTEMQCENKEGEFYWSWIDISPVKNNKDEVVNFISILTDITAQKQTEKELREAKQTAEEMNRLKSSFLANMSHEIRTPLNGIMGLAQIIEDETSEEDTLTHIKLINRSGDRLLNTINQVLDLSKIEADAADPRTEKVDIISLIDEIKIMFSASVSEKNIYLKFIKPDENIVISSDNTMLGQILTNLIGNAVKFTSKGGITVEADIQKESESEYLMISVKDTGIGISKEYQSRLFTAFSQESSGHGRNFEGSGLGLAISQRFAHLLRGEITVSSEQGKGSTFTLKLPVSDTREKNE